MKKRISALILAIMMVGSVCMTSCDVATITTGVESMASLVEKVFNIGNIDKRLPDRKRELSPTGKKDAQENMVDLRVQVLATSAVR